MPIQTLDQHRVKIMGQSIFAFTICLFYKNSITYIANSLISAFAFTYVKYKSPNANHKLNCQLYYLLWKWMETKTNRYVFQKNSLIISKTKIQFFILFSEKNAQKNRMQQLELRPLNKTDQLVAMENLHLSLSKSSIKTVTTKLSL